MSLTKFFLVLISPLLWLRDKLSEPSEDYRIIRDNPDKYYVTKHNTLGIRKEWAEETCDPHRHPTPRGSSMFPVRRCLHP